MDQETGNKRAHRPRPEDAEAILDQIASRVRSRLAGKDWTATDLAAAMGVTTSGANHWLDGQAMPPVYRIPEFCRILEMTPNELLLGRK